MPFVSIFGVIILPLAETNSRLILIDKTASFINGINKHNMSLDLIVFGILLLSQVYFPFWFLIYVYVITEIVPCMHE